MFRRAANTDRVTARRSLVAAAIVGVLLLSGCSWFGADTTVPELPHVGVARAEMPGWTQAEPTQLASVAAQVGNAADGALAMSVDSRRTESVAALSQTVAVSPSTSYELTAAVRVLSTTPIDVPASLVAGSAELDLPELTSDWTPVTLTVETAADQNSLTVDLVVDDVVTGLGIDSVRLVASSGGDNLITNGDFETVVTDVGIRNTSLVLDQATAAFAIASPSSSFSWTVTDSNGTVVGSGQDIEAAPLTAVSLASIGQGYYTAEVTTSGGETWRTPFIIIDAGGEGLQKDVRFSVGAHVERDPYIGTIVAALDSAAALGFGEIRNDVTWSRNETVPGQYDWFADYARAFDQMDALDIDLLAIAAYNNKLYDNGKTVSSPKGLAAYAAYAAAITERFGAESIEVYNEFNHSSQSNNRCGKSADCYLPLLEATHDAVKAVDPSTLIVAGSTALYDGAWFKQLWSLGGLQYADSMSFHPYEVADSSPTLGNPDLMMQIVENAQTDMDAYANGEPTPAIWITEIGWSTKVGGAGLEQQGNALVRTTIAALAGGAASVYWYDLINDEPDPADHEGNFGLFYQQLDGVAAYPPKPGAMARAVLGAEITGRELSSVDSATGEFTSVAFGTEGDEVQVAWSGAGSYEAKYEAAGVVTVTGTNGTVTEIEPIDGVATITLSDQPVFISGATGVAAP